MVQELVEEYDYDLDSSIEAVQLFRTKHRALDYLARKEDDSEEEIIYSSSLLGPDARERYDY